MQLVENKTMGGAFEFNYAMTAQRLKSLGVKCCTILLAGGNRYFVKPGLFFLTFDGSVPGEVQCPSLFAYTSLAPVSALSRFACELATPAQSHIRMGGGPNPITQPYPDIKTIVDHRSVSTLVVHCTSS
jgi:hypothetical protein